MSRKTLDDDEKNAVCVRYVQTGSLRAVAAEFGISAMRVKRLWDSIGSDQQQVIRALQSADQYCASQQNDG